MTWLFGKEKEAMQRGDIALFLYQNENVKTNLMPRLKALNDDANIRFMSFRPYFDDAAFPFMGKRLSDWFGAGHISRQEDDKFSKDILKIYEYFSSPIEKRGFFLASMPVAKRRLENRLPGSKPTTITMTFRSRNFTTVAILSCNPRTPQKTGPV